MTDTWTYRWRYPVPTGPYQHAPGRWDHELLAAAIRDAVADGLEPHAVPTVTVVPTGIDGWSEALVALSVADPHARHGDEKTCNRCGEDWPREEFYRDARRPDGLNDWCKACWRAYKAERAAS